LIKGGKIKITEDNKSRKMGLWERILRSQTIRGIFRIHIGDSFIRIWSKDIVIPRGATVHLFDYLLYLKTNKGEPFEEWIRKRGEKNGRN